MSENDENYDNNIDILNEINIYKHKCLTEFNKDLINLQDINNEEEFYKNLCDIKLKCINEFNEIIGKFPNEFENKENFNLFDKTLNEIENIMNSSEKILKAQQEENIKDFNENLLNNEYNKIQNKINNNYYNSSNVNEFIKDYETFLNNYNNKSSSNEKKMNILLDFLMEKKVEFLISFLNNLFKENKMKLKEKNEKLENINNLMKIKDEEFNKYNNK
jgi:hypothetical protein